MAKNQVMNRKFLFKHWGIAALIASLTISFGLCSWALEIPSLPISPADALTSHVRYLASDELTGRGVDTPGIKLARDYIAREFAKYGLVPAGDNGTYFQSFDVTTGVEIKQPTALALDNGPPLALNQDWIPLALSQSGKAEGEVVFAGYGITAKDYGYDDYAGIEATGKIVVVLRYEPPPRDDKSPFQKPPRYSTYAALRTKANNARDHGAAGLILVDLNRTVEASEQLISIRSGFSRDRKSVIAVQIKHQIVERWLHGGGLSLAELKEKIDRDGKPASTPLPGLKASMSVALEPLRQRAENVVGLIPGSDVKLKAENVVLGAHYDHLGFGYFGTLTPTSAGQIHHGADDNASGTAALLASAERMARSSAKPARTVIFVAFSGEELGLFGSSITRPCHFQPRKRCSISIWSDGSGTTASQYSVPVRQRISVASSPKRRAALDLKSENQTAWDAAITRLSTTRKSRRCTSLRDLIPTTTGQPILGIKLTEKAWPR